VVEFLLSETGVALTRWVAFVGTSLAIGIVMLRRVSPADCTSGAVHRLARAAGVLLLLGALLRMAQQALLFAPAPEEALGMIAVVRNTPWGSAWQLQLLAGAALVAVPRLVAGPRPAIIGTLVAMSAAAVPAFQGHAFGSERHTALAVFADVVHVLAGGLWLGTLAVLVLVSFRRPGVDLRSVLARFSPLALTGAAALAVTGTFGAWLHITPLDALWRSPYGLMLVRKLVVLAVIMGLGAVNWKRLTPRLGEAVVDGQLKRSAAFEVALGAVLLLLTAYLVATPLPGE
jgi:putative copper export protein